MVKTKTLYIDVYFLINFTVDFLALYFASALINYKPTVFRLSISSIVGALFATLIALFKFNFFVYALLLVASAALMAAIVMISGHISRYIKLIVAFVMLETLLGGIVTLVFGLVDEKLSGIIPEVTLGTENRKLITISAVILIAYGILKLSYFILKGTISELSLEIEISILDKSIKLNSLVDTGSALCDPLDSSPVILINKKSAKELLGTDELNNLGAVSPYSKRIRIIPIKTAAGEKILIGLKCDSVEITRGKQKTKYSAVVAVDDVTESFSGYPALLPRALALY